MSLRLIINADDFGWDPAATEAILELASRNAITSTTIMANLVKEDELLELKKMTSLSKGIHLNLIDGKPITDPILIKSIVNADGLFYSSLELFNRYLVGKVDNADINIEIKAQVDYLKSFGIPISHADSHQHLHIYPFIGASILKALKQSGIEKIRNVNSSDYRDKRRAVIKVFNFFSAHLVADFKSPLRLLSDFSIAKDANDSIVETSLKKVKGVTEMMVHPAFTNREGSYLNRQAEFKYLKTKSYQKLLEAKNIELISYNDF